MLTLRRCSARDNKFIAHLHSILLSVVGEEWSVNCLIKTKFFFVFFSVTTDWHFNQLGPQWPLQQDEDVGREVSDTAVFNDNVCVIMSFHFILSVHCNRSSQHPNPHVSCMSFRSPYVSVVEWCKQRGAPQYRSSPGTWIHAASVTRYKPQICACHVSHIDVYTKTFQTMITDLIFILGGGVIAE